MGSKLSKLLRPNGSDTKTGLKVLKVLETHRDNVTTLRIQPAGSLVATGDESGNLLFFDLETHAIDPQHSRHLLPEQGGISEICWLANDLIAVGTTRGKIVVFSSRNKAKRFAHICDVVAHGDGVTQVAVDVMAFAATTHCLVSVAEGKIGIKLWNIDDEGMISEQPTGEQSTEYTMPRSVAFTRNGAEIVVAYMEQAIIKRFALRPWQFLERVSLYQKDLESAEPTREGANNAYLGNAAILPRTKQLAVFDLHNGLDIYNFPELHGKREARFEVNSLATQGIAVLKSGSLIASPSKDGTINIIDCNASIIRVLRCRNPNPSLAEARLIHPPDKNRVSFRALDGLSTPSQRKEILVGAYVERNEARIVVWESQSQPAGSQPTLTYDSFTRRVLTGIVIYLLCTSIQPLLSKITSPAVKDLPIAIQSVWQPGSSQASVPEPSATPPKTERRGSWL